MRFFVMRAREAGVRNLELDTSHCIEPIGFVLPPTIHLYGNLSLPPPSFH